MSGIAAADECLDVFNAFKLQNSGNKEVHRYIIFRIRNETIVVDKKGKSSATWSEFVDAISEDPKDGAYGVFDFHTIGDDGRVYDKVIFVQWCPDKLPIRAKMLYGSTSESFKGNLGSGISHSIQATGFDDLDEDDITNIVTKA